MHENEHDEIKPAEYKELGNFKETPGYTPALDPVSKFESFEGYGAEDMVCLLYTSPSPRDRG